MNPQTFDHPFNKVNQNWLSKFPENKETEIKKLLRISSFIKQIPDEDVKKGVFKKVRDYFNGSKISKMFKQLVKGPSAKVTEAINALENLGIDSYKYFEVYESHIDRTILNATLHDKYYGKDRKRVNDIIIHRDEHESKYGAVSEDVIMDYIKTTLKYSYNAQAETYEDRSGGLGIITTYTEVGVNKPIITTYTSSRPFINEFNREINEINIKENLQNGQMTEEGNIGVAVNYTITEIVNAMIELAQTDIGSRLISMIRFCSYDLAVDEKGAPLEGNVKQYRVDRGSSIKIFDFNTLTLSINSKGELTLRGKPATKEEIIEENKKIFYKKIESIFTYSEGTLFAFIEIVSVDIWLFSIPYGGCFGTFTKVKGLKNVSDKYFSLQNFYKDNIIIPDNYKETNRCFYHCVLVHLAITSEKYSLLSKNKTKIDEFEMSPYSNISSTDYYQVANNTKIQKEQVVPKFVSFDLTESFKKGNLAGSIGEAKGSSKEIANEVNGGEAAARFPYGICDPENPDAVEINSLAKKLGFGYNEPLNLSQASLLIQQLNERLDPSQKINGPFAIVDLKELNAIPNSIIYFNDHYFLWAPPSLKVTKLKNKKEEAEFLQGIKTKEEIEQYLKSQLDEHQESVILGHVNYNSEGEIEHTSHYIHVPYDYECKKLEDGTQVPTQCGYKMPDILVKSNDEDSIILNEYGKQVSTIKYKVETSKTPGFNMVQNIFNRAVSKFMVKSLKDDGTYTMKMREEYKNDKVQIIFNAFNGSNYDSIILINELLSGGVKVVNTQTCFHQGKMMRVTFNFPAIPNISLVLFDIARFTVGSLDMNGRNFKVPALKGTFDYSLIDFKENMSQENFEKLNRYLLHDVFVLDEVTKIIRKYFANLFYCDILDYVSLPQMTYDFWRNHYCPLNVLLPSSLKEDKFYRKAAYGGIVFNYKRTYISKRKRTPYCQAYLDFLKETSQDHHEKLFEEVSDHLPQCVGVYMSEAYKKEYERAEKAGEQLPYPPKCCDLHCNDVLVPFDVNSLYPAACLRYFPCGRARSFYWQDLLPNVQNRYHTKLFKKFDKYGRETASGNFQMMSILSAFIEDVPKEFNQKAKIFPKRGKKGMSCVHKIGEKLHLTSEQFYWMEKYGYKFKIHKVTYWEEKAELLKPFMVNYYEARCIAKKTDAILEQIIKLILNSLTGKFLQRNMDSNSLFVNDPKKIRDLAHKDNIETIFKLTDQSQDSNLTPWLFIKTYKEESLMEATKPSHLSAFLLSHSKTIMLEYMEKFNILDSSTETKLGENFDELYYMDTDSFYINRRAVVSSGFKETTTLGGMKNDLGSTTAYIDKGAFLGKKMYLTEKYDIKDDRRLGAGPQYKISSKGITKPKGADTKLLNTLLQKREKSIPLNIVEEETIKQIQAQKEKYDNDMIKVVNIFKTLNEEGVAVVDGLIKFQKSFKGDNPLTIKVEDVVKVISSKCTCMNFEKFNQTNPGASEDEKKEFCELFQKFHPNNRNSKKCPLLLEKIKSLKLRQV